MDLKYYYDKLAFVFLLFILLSCLEQKHESAIDDNFLIENSVIETIKQRSENEILVCAHRGYHKFAPENSLEAVQKAINANIDIVELDVNITKDGILVLMHDDSIDRTTTGRGYVSQLTYSELKEFYLKINDSITNHKIPTLTEALELAKDKIILNLDLKRVDVGRFYSQLKSKNMEYKVFSFIWDSGRINELLAIDSLYAVLPLVSNTNEMMYYAENVASKLQHFNEDSFDLENMTWANNNDILVLFNSLWEVDENFIQNDMEDIDEIIELRPAIIQTDHPVMLTEYLRSKNLHD